jgi:hypothetical protein
MRISNGQQIRFMVILLLGSAEAPLGANERKLILLLGKIDLS